MIRRGSCGGVYGQTRKKAKGNSKQCTAVGRSKRGEESKEEKRTKANKGVEKEERKGKKEKEGQVPFVRNGEQGHDWL